MSSPTALDDLLIFSLIKAAKAASLSLDLDPEIVISESLTIGKIQIALPGGKHYLLPAYTTSLVVNVLRHPSFISDVIAVLDHLVETYGGDTWED